MLICYIYCLPCVLISIDSHGARIYYRSAIAAILFLSCQITVGFCRRASIFAYHRRSTGTPRHKRTIIFNNVNHVWVLESYTRGLIRNISIFRCLSNCIWFNVSFYSEATNLIMRFAKLIRLLIRHSVVIISRSPYYKECNDQNITNDRFCFHVRKANKRICRKREDEELFHVLGG